MVKGKSKELLKEDSLSLSIIIPTRDKERENIDSIKFLEPQLTSPDEILVYSGYTASEARNIGIEESKNDYLVFLDDDSIPEPNFLPNLRQALSQDRVVQGRVIHPKDDLIRKMTPYIGGEEKKEVDSLTACNMAIERGVFEEVGKFNEDLPYGHEEKELADRIIKEGIRISYYPEVAVKHSHADSLKGYYQKMFSRGYYIPVYWRLSRTPVSERLNHMLPYGSAEGVLPTILKSIGFVVQDLGTLKRYLVDRNEQ